MLIGLPELFREFSDYRLLFYGIALMIIMIVRPEGLLPTKVARRELHSAGELLTIPEAELLPAQRAARRTAEAEAAAAAKADVGPDVEDIYERGTDAPSDRIDPPSDPGASR